MSQPREACSSLRIQRFLWRSDQVGTYCYATNHGTEIWTMVVKPGTSPILMLAQVNPDKSWQAGMACPLAPGVYKQHHQLVTWKAFWGPYSQELAKDQSWFQGLHGNTQGLSDQNWYANFSLTSLLTCFGGRMGKATQWFHSLLSPPPSHPKS